MHLLVYVNADRSIAKVCDTPEMILHDYGKSVANAEKLYVQKNMVEDLNPDEVDIVYAVWDNKRQILVDEDDAREEPQEDISNRELHAALRATKSLNKRAKIVRFERDSRLCFLDRMVCNPIRWEEFDDSTREEMRDYRRALLDVTKHEGFTSVDRSIVFPKMPLVVSKEFDKP
jgi:hypothetical protein